MQDDYSLMTNFFDVDFSAVINFHAHEWE